MGKKLVIKNLSVSVDGSRIIDGFSLSVEPGKVHALMGPNGSGKSTLAYTIMGHPRYVVTSGTVRYGRSNILALNPHERAKQGLFLAFQYPLEISGVRLGQFLRMSYNTLHPTAKLTPAAFRTRLLETMSQLCIDPGFADRYLNEGFSGGEKKKTEVLQMRILTPSMVICDETDSGLDVDALKLVASGVSRMVAEGAGALVITHYQRLLNYLQPDVVHVMNRGKLISTGDATLVTAIEQEGYRPFVEVGHA